MVVVLVTLDVLGIGIDLVDIRRVERMLEKYRPQVMRRLVTPTERAYLESLPRPAASLAARIAAKEAAYKALQSLPGGRSVTWTDLEVDRRGDGRPSLRLLGKAADLAEQHGPLRIELSLTHSDFTAGAVALLVRGSTSAE
jgi:holo-[acyl-carrier protein] synthase